jgi:Leucine-rich repeat (LRR) protein
MLNHNSIQRIPEELGMCLKLHTVDFSFNKINMVPPDMGRIPDIKMIKLANNPLDPDLKDQIRDQTDKWQALKEYITSPDYDQKWFSYQKAEDNDESIEMSEGEVGIID